MQGSCFKNMVQVQALRLGMVGLGGPRPVIVTIKDNKNHIRVLLKSYYTTTTGWGVLLRYRGGGLMVWGLEFGVPLHIAGTAVWECPPYTKLRCNEVPVTPSNHRSSPLTGLEMPDVCQLFHTCIYDHQTY